MNGSHAFGGRKRLPEGVCEAFTVGGVEERANWHLHAPGLNSHLGDANFLVAFHAEAGPERVEAVLFHLSRQRHLADKQARSRKCDFLSHLGGAVIQFESNIKRQHIKPEEADDRPGPEAEEHGADEQPSTDQRSHQHNEPCPPERAVWDKKRLEERRIGGILFQHGSNYRAPMEKPKLKNKTSSAISKLSPAAATASKPAPRRGRKRALTAYSVDELNEIFRRFEVQRPEPKGELEHVNVFTLLVAVVLSAQATDAGVNKATRALFEIADTPQKMLALGEEKVGEYIRTIGLWRNKAKNVILLSEALLRDHGGEVPGDRDALVKLPGVGRKTANVVLNMFFGQPTMAVDTHIFRIANRILLAPGKNVDEVEQALLKVVPEQYLLHAHHWLILHGRYVCKARKPECERCVIADLCKAPEKTNDIPAPLVLWEETGLLPEQPRP